MAVCKCCHQEMTDPKTVSCCDFFLIRIKGVDFKPILYGSEHSADEFPGKERCRDCSVKKGHAHHPGCDWEECPKCGGQELSCACRDGDEDDD